VERVQDQNAHHTDIARACLTVTQNHCRIDPQCGGFSNISLADTGTFANVQGAEKESSRNSCTEVSMRAAHQEYVRVPELENYCQHTITNPTEGSPDWREH
jgi:hypothetical protein